MRAVLTLTPFGWGPR